MIGKNIYIYGIRKKDILTGSFLTILGMFVVGATSTYVNQQVVRVRSAKKENAAHNTY